MPFGNSEAIATEVSALLLEAYRRAEEAIAARRDRLGMIVQRLIEVETMDGRDVEEIVEFGRLLTEEERKAREEKEQAPGDRPQAAGANGQSAGANGQASNSGAPA